MFWRFCESDIPNDISHKVVIIISPDGWMKAKRLKHKSFSKARVKVAVLSRYYRHWCRDQHL